MDPRTLELLNEISRNPPATDIAVQQLQAACGIELPVDYVDFLRFSNGGHGNVGPNAYVELFPAEQIPVLNTAARTAEFAPGLLVFASNGMGTSYAFDTRQAGSRIVEVDDMRLSLDAAIQRGRSFLDFLEYLFHASPL